MDEERTTSGPDAPGSPPPAPKKAARKAVKEAPQKATGRAPAKAAAEPAATRSAQGRKAAAKRVQVKKAEPAKAPAKKATVKKAQPAKAAAKQAPATKAQARKAGPAKTTPTKVQARKAEPVQAEPANTTPTKAPARKAAKSAARKTAVKRAPAQAVREPAATEAAREPTGAVREAAPTQVVREPAPVVREPAEPRSVREPSGTLAVRPQRPELTAWLDAVTDLARHPDRPQSLERLAALAVAQLGPRAEHWAGWLRDTYPTAPPTGMARLAARRATTTGRRLGMLAAAGPLGALLPFPATEWARATLVLRIAAAYGHDPSDPRRVPELLELLELRTSGGTKALRHAVNRAGWRLGRLLAARLVLGPIRVAGAARALIALADQEEEMERLAHRAMLHYRGNPRPPRQRTPADQGRFSVSRNSA